MNEPAAATDRGERLFFALWPEDAARAELTAVLTPLLVGISGRVVNASQWHLTLEFLGTLYVAQRECAERAASHVTAAAFDLALTQFGYFHKPQVVWVGAAASPPALAGLVDDLRGGLRACGLTVDERPYVPHMTVLRKVRRKPHLPEFAGVRWRVNNFVLVRSTIDARGARYDVVKTWPLHEQKSDA